MQIVRNATYKDGILKLDESLGQENNGKTYKVLLFDDEIQPKTKEAFMQAMKKYHFKLEEGYKFDREELHER